MPLLGAHMSIAGGLHLAFERIRQVGGEAMQIFTKNQVQWRVPPLGPEEVARFREEWERSDWIPVASHASYLINLAVGKPQKADQAVSAFSEELRRCAMLGTRFLITHSGAHLGDGVEEGLARFARNLDRAISIASPPNVMILLETTAGQGTGLGSSFEEIASIIDRSSYGDRLGVCYDTCHTFAAGYDIRTPEAYQETMTRFQQVVGLDRLMFFHLNDSKKGLGSRVDRHEHIGKGEIGKEGFRHLLNDPRFQAHPMVLETPKGKDLKQDRLNLRRLRALVARS
jgi:deoxyribonuclease IV